MEKITRKEVLILQKKAVRDRNMKLLGRGLTPMKTFETMDLRRTVRLLVLLSESEDKKILIQEIKRMTKLQLPEKMFLPIIRNIGLIDFDSAYCWLLEPVINEVNEIINLTRIGNVPEIKKILFKRLYKTLPMFREAVNYSINQVFIPNIENTVKLKLDIKGLHAKGLISLLAEYGPFFQPDKNKSKLKLNKNKSLPCETFGINLPLLIIETYQILSKFGETKLIQVPLQQLQIALRDPPPIWMGNAFKFESLGDYEREEFITFYSPIARTDLVRGLNDLIENQKDFGVSITPSLGAQPFDPMFKYDTISIEMEDTQ